jgi:GntR family transcriptional regulator, rspAB operon transcriptional repressor
VPTKRASDVAYEMLQERIVDLRLPPGTFLNEQRLADQLGLGRVPVREALARLAGDRFITVLPRRGNVVTQLALDDILDMFEAREAIECGVAYIAATRASQEDIEELRRLVEAADRARGTGDYEQFLRDDHAVHTFLVHMIRNPLLQDAGDRLLLHSLRFWRTYWSNRPANLESMLSHADLIAALESRDPDLAEKAMREHLTTSRQLVKVLF